MMEYVFFVLAGIYVYLVYKRESIKSAQKICQQYLAKELAATTSADAEENLHSYHLWKEKDRSCTFFGWNPFK